MHAALLFHLFIKSQDTSMLKVIYAVLISLLCTSFANANDNLPSQTDRTSTGGAQTLDDILARQKGLNIDDEFRRRDDGSKAIGAELFNQLGTLGGASDPGYGAR